MSNEALNWAFKFRMKAGPKFVLVALSDYADEDHSCYPRFEKLEEKTGIAAKTVAVHVRLLEKYGLLTRTRKRHENGYLGSYRYTLSLQKTNANIENTDLAIKAKKSRGKPFEKSEKNNPDAKLGCGDPDLKLGVTTPKIGQNHTLILGDNNPQVNHQNNHQGDVDEIKAWFDRIWTGLNPKLLKSRRVDKQGAYKCFVLRAKEHGLDTLVSAIRQFYDSPEVRKNGYEFAPALKFCLTGRKYEGFIGSSGQSEMSTYLENRKAAEQRDRAREEA